MSEIERHIQSDPAQADERARELYGADPDAGERTDPEHATPSADVEDPAINLPGDDDYKVPVADVGDANKSQGIDHAGGYGYRAIPQEGGPDQDH
jgi:hypothetical protein